MFEPTQESHQILFDLAEQANIRALDSRMVGIAVALYGKSGDSGRVSKSMLPQEYRKFTELTNPVEEHKAIVTQYIDTFNRMFTNDQHTIKSLYLWSPRKGNGKTTTACVLLNEWLKYSVVKSFKHKQKMPTTPAFFLDVNEWQTLFNQFNRPRVPESIAEPAANTYYSWYQQAQKAPFAVFDDIGVRSATEAFRGDLHTLINYRVANNLPTVYTSNESLEDFSLIFDERLYDRVRDECAIVKFTGKSQRGEVSK